MKSRAETCCLPFVLKLFDIFYINVIFFLSQINDVYPWQSHSCSVTFILWWRPILLQIQKKYFDNYIAGWYRLGHQKNDLGPLGYPFSPSLNKFSLLCILMRRHIVDQDALLLEIIFTYTDDSPCHVYLVFAGIHRK